MPVSFLSDEQRKNYGQYAGVESPNDLTRYFHLDDTDHALITQKRGKHNRLGFAAQLCTVRYLGTFLDDPLEAAPASVLHTLAEQLRIEAIGGAREYSTGEQRWEHAMEIRAAYGYVEIIECRAGFRLPTGYTRCAGPALTGRVSYSSGRPHGWDAQGAAARM